MANDAIGRFKCPLCASPKGRVSVNSAGLAYVTFNCCHAQLMIRSATGDALLRNAMTPEPAYQEWLSRQAPPAFKRKPPAPVEPPEGQAIIVAPTLAAEKLPKPAHVEPTQAATPEEPAQHKPNGWNIY